MSTIEFIVLAIGLLAVLGLQFALFARSRRTDGSAHAFERLERELRHELQASAQSTRQEMANHLAQNQAATPQPPEAMRQPNPPQSPGRPEKHAPTPKRPSTRTTFSSPFPPASMPSRATSL